MLPKSVSTPFGVAALLRSAEFLRETNDPRFAEAQLQPENHLGNGPYLFSIRQSTASRSQLARTAACVSLLIAPVPVCWFNKHLKTNGVGIPFVRGRQHRVRCRGAPRQLARYPNCRPCGRVLHEGSCNMRVSRVKPKTQFTNLARRRTLSPSSTEECHGYQEGTVCRFAESSGGSR